MRIILTLASRCQRGIFNKQNRKGKQKMKAKKTVTTMTEKAVFAVLNENYKNSLPVLDCAAVYPVAGVAVRSDLDCWVSFPAPGGLGEGCYTACAGHWQAMPDVEIADFPPVPCLIDAAVIDLDAAVFLDALKALAPACSRDETRFVLNGINCDLTRDGLTMTSTDGRRLHTVDCLIDYAGPDCSFILHPVMVARLLKHGTPGALVMRISGNMENGAPVSFAFESGLVITGKTIDGFYPNFKQAIPAQSSVDVTIPRAGLQTALKSLDPYIKAERKKDSLAGFIVYHDQDAGLIKFAMRSQVETINGRFATVATSKCDNRHPAGEPFNGMLQPAFWQDATTAALLIGGDSVVIGITDNLAPVTLTSGALRIVLMPMRLEGFERAEFAKVEKAA